jgi:hypothetical protein
MRQNHQNTQHDSLCGSQQCFSAIPRRSKKEIKVLNGLKLGIENAYRRDVDSNILQQPMPCPTAKERKSLDVGIGKRLYWVGLSSLQTMQTLAC